MNERRVNVPIETPLMSGGSRRQVVAGLLAAVIAAHAVSGETAASERRQRLRRRNAACHAAGDDIRLIVSGVAAGGEAIALLPGRMSARGGHAVRFAWDRDSAAVVARGRVLLPDGRSLDFAGPVDLTGSAGSCERVLLEIDPLDLVAPGAPVQIALLLPAVQAAREAARRRLCEIARLLALGSPTRELVAHLNAIIPPLVCSMGDR